MSKNKKANIPNIDNTKNEKKEKAPKEEMTKGEILFTRIIIGLGVLIIAIIILVNIPYNGEKERIARKYNSLTSDNVFTYIEYDELQEKVSKGEKFELLLINTDLEDANYYIYCVNLIVKEYQDNELNICEQVYIFNTYDISTSEARYFKDMEKNILKQPSLIHFEPTISTNSVDVDCSVRYSLSEYNDNYYNMLVEYFSNNYEE